MANVPTTPSTQTLAYSAPYPTQPKAADAPPASPQNLHEPHPPDTDS
jgi:hypothetical protein